MSAYDDGIRWTARQIVAQESGDDIAPLLDDLGRMELQAVLIRLNRAARRAQHYAVVNRHLPAAFARAEGP